MKNLQLGILIFIIATGSLPGVAPGAPDHPEKGHDNPECGLCHLRTAKSASTLATDNQTCINCHRGLEKSQKLDLGFHPVSPNGPCLGCHSFHSPEAITTALGTINLESLDQVNREHCASCHNASGSLESLSEAHKVAARLYHEETLSLKNISPSQGCLNCHSDATATAWQAATGGDVLAFREHSSHPFEVELIAGQGSYAHRIKYRIDPRIPLVDQTIQCQTCHQLNSGNTDLIAVFKESTDLCLGCHQFRDQAQDNVVAALTRRP